MSQTNEVKQVPEVCANCGRFLRMTAPEMSRVEYSICEQCLTSNPKLIEMLKALKKLRSGVNAVYRALQVNYGMMSKPSYHPKFEDLLGILEKPKWRHDKDAFALAVRIWRIEDKTRLKMQRSWNGELNMEGGKRVWHMQDAYELACKRFRLMFGDPELQQSERNR